MADPVFAPAKAAAAVFRTYDRNRDDWIGRKDCALTFPNPF